MIKDRYYWKNKAVVDLPKPKCISKDCMDNMVVYSPDFLDNI
jgi:hypothetical protein